MRPQEAVQGIVMEVYIKPRSKQFQLAVENDEVTVYCREVPVKGRVNRELIRGLSRLFERRVEIVSGFSSRQKKVLIEDISLKEVNKILSACT